MSARRLALTACFALVAGPAASQPAADAVSKPERRYALSYDVRIVPTERAARVAIRVGSGARYLRSLRLRIDPARHLDFEGNGSVEVNGDTVTWRPPKGGGSLRYLFRIDHLRDERSYDARCAESWAVFRGDDLVPPANVRTLVGARSRASLRIDVPRGWTVAVPYHRGADGRFEIDHPHRRFDRPTGWMIAGRLGIARERVSGTRVAIAAPVGHHFARLDVLALLRWTLPRFRRVVGTLPDRLLVVGAGDPMWRGGLSGPRSLFVHAERPLISNDGTSPVLHEVVHAVLGLEPGPGADAVVEGLAEFYSLELLVRSRTLSRSRYEKSLARLEERGRGVLRLLVDRAGSQETARAVTVLRELDAKLRADSEDERSLDDVVRVLAERRGTLTVATFRELAQETAGSDLSDFFRRRGLGESPARR